MKELFPQSQQIKVALLHSVKESSHLTAIRGIKIICSVDEVPNLEESGSTY